MLPGQRVKKLDPQQASQMPKLVRICRLLRVLSVSTKLLHAFLISPYLRFCGSTFTTPLCEATVHDPLVLFYRQAQPPMCVKR